MGLDSALQSVGGSDEQSPERFLPRQSGLTRQSDFLALLGVRVFCDTHRGMQFSPRRMAGKIPARIAGSASALCISPLCFGGRTDCAASLVPDSRRVRAARFVAPPVTLALSADLPGDRHQRVD